MADEKDSKWQCYIIPNLATWTEAAGSKPHTPIEFFDTYEQAAARFQELRSEPYNSEDLSAARLTFGVQREDPPGAADLLQDRQGKNYLVDDYTRMASVNQSPEVMGILKQMRKDLGFDRVRVYERDAYRDFCGPKDMAFSRRNIERSQEYEQLDLFSERGLSDPGPGPRSGPSQAPGQVRTNAAYLSQNPPASDLQSDAAVREPVFSEEVVSTSPAYIRPLKLVRS